MIVLFIATVVCAVANGFIAVADYRKAKFVVNNSAQVRVPISALPVLATLKLAGALGLVVGLLALPWLGFAAAVGLLLFFFGALVVHARAHVFRNIAFPGVYLLLAAASATYLLRIASNT